MNIQWFPGHMTKTGREMTADVKLVDLIVELVDARIPRSSRNPDLDRLTQGKPRLLVLTKIDLADPKVTSLWEQEYTDRGQCFISVNAMTGQGVKRVFAACEQTLEEKIRRDQEKGMVNRKIRMMVAGVPNVGKSSLINRLSGRSSTKTGDRPGVTRGKQWIRLKNGFELLDTPGILWPKFEQQETGLHLAFTGAVKDDVVDAEELACELIGSLRGRYATALTERYKLETLSNENYGVLEQISRNRGFMMRGGEADTRRGAAVLLDEFRGGVLGKISLELPDGKEESV